MNGLLEAVPGLVGVFIGAAIGIYGIRWQHKAQLLQEIRTKGAELIFLGDQYRDDSRGSSFLGYVRRRSDPPLPPQPQNVRMEQMRSIVRYLELAADKKVYNLASSFRRATEALSSSGHQDPDHSEAEHRFVEARNALLGALKAHKKGK